MFPLRIAALMILVSGLVFAGPDEPKKPVPKFKIGKDTTFVDGPLDADGYIDYEAALNTLLKGKCTPDTNAVVLLLKCIGPKPEGKELHPDFYKALGVAAPPETGEYLVPHSKHFQAELQGEDRKDFEDLDGRTRSHPWKPADAPKHVEWLARNQKPIAVAEAASLQSYYNPAIARDKNGKRAMLMTALPTIIFGCRQIGSLLSTRVMLKLGEGATEAAFADALTIHRLGRLITRGGFWFEYLVGLALQASAHKCELAILEFGQPTVKQAQAYRAELLKLPAAHSIADELQHERFQHLDAVQSNLRDGFDLFRAKNVDKQNADEMASKLDWNSILRVGNSWYDRLESAMREPTRAGRVAAGVKITADLKAVIANLKRVASVHELIQRGEADKLGDRVNEMMGQAYVKLLIPAFNKLADAADRAEQVHRNGILATGLAAHFADTGKYPDALADLVPKYLAKVPNDAFNEKPLTYPKTDAGYLFYSVGTNGVDDGGKLLTDEPRGDDVGVRMPGK